jgi:hypothetical protein
MQMRAKKGWNEIATCGEVNPFRANDTISGFGGVAFDVYLCYVKANYCGGECTREIIQGENSIFVIYGKICFNNWMSLRFLMNLWVCSAIYLGLGRENLWCSVLLQGVKKIKRGVSGIFLTKLTRKSILGIKYAKFTLPPYFFT